ncbi:AaceriADL282Wp [[Ashbya] aceris (nom. inval.)]|nr:AaceriADL282Wp [[Ashbya] aceris (nom. inval.)]
MMSPFRLLGAGCRFLSTNSRPPLHKIFPSKKLVNRMLFDLDSRLTFRKLLPVYEQVYAQLDSSTEDLSIPSSVRAHDVMIMKKVLEKTRHRTKSTNRHLLALENELLYMAAQMGHRDAAALLAFDTLCNPASQSEEDMNYAKLMVKDFYRAGHPLTLKLTGDLALANGDHAAAEENYLKFLEKEADTFLAGEVYGQLGKISFLRSAFSQAEERFLHAIRLSPLEYSVQSYFYLGQLYMNSDPLKARSLLESAASQGFKESFKTLGHLEMNYFCNMPKAREWFKLGMELGELECMVGCFDCAIALEDFALAQDSLKRLELMAKTDKIYQELYTQFVDYRHDKLSLLESYKAGKALDVSGSIYATENRKIVSSFMCISNTMDFYGKQ